MPRHATRWTVLTVALVLALPAQAQSKSDDMPTRAPASWTVLTGIFSAKRGEKGLQLPSLSIETRAAAAPWSVEAFRGGDPDLFFEDFNGVDPAAAAIPAGWARFETGAGATQQWLVRDFVVNGVTERLAFSRYEDVPDGQQAIDWLVTPEITVGGAGTLNFGSAQNYTDEYNTNFDILVSTTSQTDPASFTLVRRFREIDFPLVNLDGIGLFSVDLSAYVGQPVYIAFRSSQDNGDNWLLDNVSVTLAGGGPATPGLAEDFEGVVASGAGSVLPTGWTRFDAAGNPDGASTWGVYGETSTAPPDTNNVAGSRDEAGAQVDYLVSPLAGIAAGDFLLFDGAQQYTGEYGSTYEVRISTTVPDDPAAFTTVASYVESDFPTLASGALAPKAIDLTAYAGQDVYVAFVHTQDFSDSFFIDNVRTAVPSNLSVASAGAAVQYTTTVTASPDLVPILGANLVLDGDVGTLEVTQLTFSTAGTDDVGDIGQAVVAYTGATPAGSPALFGAAVPNPNGTFTVTGSRAIGPGSNYFVVYYVVPNDPSAPHLLDATFESATVGGTSVLADPTALDGAVSLVIPPANDDIADAIALTGTSGTVTGTNVGATPEDNEPPSSCTTQDLGNAVWWSYTPSGFSGDLSVSLEGSDYDTVLTIYTADLTELGCNDDISDTNLQSRLDGIPVHNGETVLIRVGGFSGDAGAITLTYAVTGVVAAEGDADVAFGLSAFRPNPTAGPAAVTLSVDRAQEVTVEVIDLLGRRVRTLHQGPLAAGTVVLRLPAGLLAPGTYLVHAVGDTLQSMQRLTVTR